MYPSVSSLVQSNNQTLSNSAQNQCRSVTIEVCCNLSPSSWRKSKLPRFRSISEYRVADHLMCAQHFRLSGQTWWGNEHTQKNAWKQLTVLRWNVWTERISMALDLQWLLTQSQCVRLQLNGWDTLWTWPYTAASCNIMDHAVHQIKLRRHDSNARLMHALHPSQECQWDGWCIHHKLHSLITIVELH